MKAPPHHTRFRQARLESRREKALRRMATLPPSPHPSLDLRSEPVFPHGRRLDHLADLPDQAIQTREL